MNAVINKPRAKATPKAPVNALQARLDSIFANLKLGQEKLQLAHQSVEMTDPGDAADVLLRSVIEDMLPAAIAPIYRQPLTKADASQAYTGMFPSLAAIDGVIALSRGQVIESMLREAWTVLDEANSQMDFADLNGLPEGSQPIAAPAQGAAEAKSASNWDEDEMHEVNAMICEAIAVMRSRSEEANTDLLYGAIYAAQHAQSVLALGLHNQNARECEDASAPIGVVCAVLDAVFLEVDDIALHGAWRLLDLAHARLDAAVSKAAA
ncbi:hypothetical protein D3C86_977250 [compost metagenome]